MDKSRHPSRSMGRWLMALLLVMLSSLATRAAEAYAHYSGGTLTFYYDNLRSSRTEPTYDLNTGTNAPGWYTIRTSVTRVTFSSSFANARPTTTYGWFSGMSNLQSFSGLQYLNTSSVTNMSDMFYGCSRLTGLDLNLSNFVTYYVTDMSYMFYGCSAFISLNVSRFNTSSVTNMASMFYGCSSLKSLDVSRFNTARVTDMSRMFQNCGKLTSLDVSSFSTANVTDMSYMFSGCTGLTSLDVSGFSTANVTNMSYMFEYCLNLTTLDVSRFNTAKVTNMSRMFYICSGLNRLDVSSFNTALVTNMSYMFYDCTGLITIYAGDEWSTVSVTSSSYMFSSCRSLVGGQGTTYDSSHVNAEYAHIDGGTSNPGYFTELVLEPYACYTPENTTLTFYYDKKRGIRPGTIYDLNTSTNYPRWYSDGTNSSVTRVVFDPSFADARPTSTWCWFYKMTNLASITGMPYLNTSNVTEMYGMFCKCSGLTSLDVSHFNTANVTRMSDMFRGCSGLTSLDVSNFNTAKVTDMSYMFSDCSGLTSLDVSNFNTAKVTGISDMFAGCSGLTSLDVSNFNTEKMKYIGGMFSKCSGLTSLDVSNFNTSNVTDMYCMFSGCSGLTSLDVSNFNTAKVTNISEMFAGCSGLTSLDVSSFNTANVTNMRYMFAGCSGLTSLDVSSFNIENVVYMLRMFSSCSGLKTIYVGDGWSTAAVTESTDMFYNCTRLVGGMGTTYDANHTDKTYAHIDGGPSNPGYFTEKPKEAYACYTSDNTTLTFYYDTQRSSRTGTTYDLNTGSQQTGWYVDETYSHVTQVVIDPSFVEARPTSTYMWFYGMENVHSIKGLNYLNTESVTNMAAMFMGCSGFTSLDLSHFNTTMVTDMFHMFYDCSNLTSLDVSSFNTAGVQDMRGMFRECGKLTILDLSSFNTAMVEIMNQMFSGDTQLVTIYVGQGWSTESLNYSYEMFENCTSLLGGQGTTYDANHMDAEYAHIDGGTANPGYFTEKVPETEAYACYTPENTTLTFYYDTQRSSRTGTTYDLNTGSFIPGWNNVHTNVTKVVFDPSFANARPTSTNDWFYAMEKLQFITGMSYLNTSEVTNMSSMFFYCSALTSLDLSSFNTANVTDMSKMFYYCKKLTSLDLSSFNTAKVTDMCDMFRNCSSLSSLDLSSFNTANVTDMSDMFRGGSSLSSLDLSSFNTAKVTNMTNMFYNCTNLRTIYVGSGWSTAAVEYSLSMFRDCSSLVGGQGTTYDESHVNAAYAHIDGGPTNPGYLTEKAPDAYACYTSDNTTLTFYYDTQRSSRPGTTFDMNEGSNPPGWYTGGFNSRVTNVVFDPSFADARPTTTYYWFYYMPSLTSITGMEYLNTSEVTDMSFMFFQSTCLTSLDLSSFNTSKVTDMSSMFFFCSSLTSLDLSSFNTSKVTSMNYMFYNCSVLASVDLSRFNTSKVTNMAYMFGFCSSLTSLDLSSFNTANVTNMLSMFTNCPKLTTIYAGDGWNTDAVTNSSGMFGNCTHLVGGMGTTYSSSHVDASYAHIDGGTSNPGYFTEKPAYLRGDVNGDRQVKIGDVTALINYLLSGDATGINVAAADCDQNGDVKIGDVTALINYLLSGTW